MGVKFDPKKDAINRCKHGISLARANEFDFDTAIVGIDDSQDYGETRFIAVGFLNARLFTLVFTEDEGAIRAINLRESTWEEEQDYAESN
jgi:uncharacterized DUF497 family protein